MRYSILWWTFLLAPGISVAQQTAYKLLVYSADSLFHAGEYKAAAEAFSSAFAVLGGKGQAADRYLAARAWARAGVPDSAFFHLQRLLDKTDYLDQSDLPAMEPDFESLHPDFRWTRLSARRQNKLDRLVRIQNDPLSIELEQIYYWDQYYRTRRDSVMSIHGSKSPVMDDWRRRTIQSDSTNTKRVCEILDQQGWPGRDRVTDRAGRAVFLVLQHADLAAQEKYLPLMREAVKAGNADAGNLAYLEDRVLMRRGLPQRYGSQIVPDKITGEWILYTVEDPDNIDERRRSVGLGPIRDYLEMTGAVWKKE